MKQLKYIITIISLINLLLVPNANSQVPKTVNMVYVYPGDIQKNNKSIYPESGTIRSNAYVEAAAQIGRASCRERV